MKSISLFKKHFFDILRDDSFAEAYLLGLSNVERKKSNDKKHRLIFARYALEWHFVKQISNRFYCIPMRHTYVNFFSI